MQKTTNRRDFIKMLGASAAAASALMPYPAWASAFRKNKKKPNIVFFLVDDMGQMDSTVYGSKFYNTPNMERLASMGMTFTNAYAANPLCSPTRASIMTGKYPNRLGITGASGHLPPQPDVPMLKNKAANWSKMACPRSKRFMPIEEYTFAEAFKQAGYDTAFIGKWHLGHEKYWPEHQGFDYTLASGQYPGPPSHFSPYNITTIEDGPEGEYLTDRLTNEAIDYIEKHQENPFLLCLWHYTVHHPHQAKESITKNFRDKTDPRGKQESAIMASMLESMDQSLGKVIDKLEQSNMIDDTIIIFTSDNGGVDFSTIEGKTPTNNYPLRKGKASIYEGGTREPCIIAWPKMIKPASKSDEIISSIDFFPTMLEMADISPKQKTSFDGESIVPILTQKGKLKRSEIFCHFPHYVLATKNIPSTYVRQGNWKLIRFYGEGPNRTNAYELYNLKNDISETTNLADKMPEKVKALDALITNHLAETDSIIPVKNIDYNPKAFNPITDKPVDGWFPSISCKIVSKDNQLHVISTGTDPFIYTKEVPKIEGKFTFKFQMKSNSKGGGQIYWASNDHHYFHHTKIANFTPIHDDQWHDYAIELPVVGWLHQLRIDPSAAPGNIIIRATQIQKPDGTILNF